MANSFKDLLAYTAAYTRFPIPARDVREWIIEHQLLDEIHFIEAQDFNQRTIRGMFRRYRRCEGVYRDVRHCAQILYAPDMNVCWSRFTWVKEMTHAFDNGPMEAKTEEEVDLLLERLVFPVKPDQPDHKNPGITLPFAADQVAEVRALMVLAPIEIVRTLRPSLESGARTPYDVALFLRIPEAWVSLLMTDIYEELFKVFGG